jgi:starvation-inducible DNA-binding protein
MLADSLKIALASSYVFQIKVQNFHWNVEGPDFPQYHEFLDNLYTEINDNAIDQTAELIRQLDQYAPGSITRFAELSIIQDQVKIPRAELMIAELYEDSMKLLQMWKEMFPIAEQENEQGIADFIASRIDAHGKHNWMLRSILKKQRA